MIGIRRRMGAEDLCFIRRRERGREKGREERESGSDI